MYAQLQASSFTACPLLAAVLCCPVFSALVDAALNGLQVTGEGNGVGWYLMPHWVQVLILVVKA